MTAALFVGRFQPFHKGHEHAIKHLFERFDDIVIAVGSINKTNKENPFTFEQRKEMIDAALKHFRGKYQVVAVPDTKSDALWKKSLLEKAKFDTVVSRNPWTIKCFRGFVIMEQPLLEPKKYDASRIRKLMRGKKRKVWEELLPKEVVDIVDKLKPQKARPTKKRLAKRTKVKKARHSSSKRKKRRK